jgi:hypothetical protein
MLHNDPEDEELNKMQLVYPAVYLLTMTISRTNACDNTE